MSAREYRLTRVLETAVRATPGTIALSQAYGIGLDESVKMPLYQDLPVTLGPKRVIYVTGESGAGKSLLLKDLRAAACRDFAIVTPDEIVAKDEPLIDLFEGVAMIRAAQFLAWAGISEPFVMLRRPCQLSDGQRYRLMMARCLFLGARAERPLVVLDEFCAVLDRETAKAVAHNVRKIADATGICFALASTHADLIEHVDADAVYTLRLNAAPEVAAKTQSLLQGATQ